MFKRFIAFILNKLGMTKSAPGSLPVLELEESVSHPPVKSTRTVRLGVIIGHESKAGGALSARIIEGLHNEYHFNTVIAKEIQAASVGSSVEVVVITRDGIGIAGAYQKAFDSKCDCVVELHFNAFNKTAKGTLTYTSPASEDVEFAHAIHKAMVGVFGVIGRPDRGVVALSRGDRGSRNVFSFNGMPNCLVEPVFGDVYSEITLLWDKRVAYAKCIISAVTLWAMKKDLL